MKYILLLTILSVGCSNKEQEQELIIEKFREQKRIEVYRELNGKLFEIKEWADKHPKEMQSNLFRNRLLDRKSHYNFNLYNHLYYVRHIDDECLYYIANIKSIDKELSTLPEPSNQYVEFLLENDSTYSKYFYIPELDRELSITIDVVSAVKQSLPEYHTGNLYISCGDHLWKTTLKEKLDQAFKE